MVIKIIDIQGVALFKPEDHPPVGSNRYRPRAFRLAFERMKPLARHVHITDNGGGVKPCESVAKLDCVFVDHAARIVVLIKAFQSFVADRPDHALL